MNLTNYKEAFYLLLSTLFFFSVTYIGVGFYISLKFKKGIKKIWLERDPPKLHIFWTYFTSIIAWYWVDWENVEIQHKWMEYIERKGEKNEKENQSGVNNIN